MTEIPTPQFALEPGKVYFIEVDVNCISQYELQRLHEAFYELGVSVVIAGSQGGHAVRAVEASEA